ncbi:MAG: NUDIX hydrolase [Pseudomonadota bacterium]|nr:NUDIX hydrolase [Pseudomonadota bacterium]
MTTPLSAGAHALILRDDGLGLVTHRAPDKSYMPDKWDLPGGTLETGESPVQALTREIREETGLTVDIGPLVHVYNNMIQFPERQGLQMVFLARYTGGEIRLNSGEHSEYLWVTLEDMARLDTINFLADFLAAFPHTLRGLGEFMAALQGPGRRT